MDRMYAPWRLAYVRGAADDDVVPAPSGCIFCDYVLPRCAPLPNNATEPNRRAFDERRLVVTVREHASVILNKFPYGNGHALVVPHAHVEHVDELDEATFTGTQSLLRETIAAIRVIYKPDGLNVGMNVGAAAGAGIAAHCHWHVVPRWRGDVNFMPVLADVKVISEGLSDSWQRLAARLRAPDEDST
jgi:ATP adenylyltransferase